MNLMPLRMPALSLVRALLAAAALACVTFSAPSMADQPLPPAAAATTVLVRLLNGYVPTPQEEVAEVHLGIMDLLETKLVVMVAMAKLSSLGA